MGKHFEDLPVEVRDAIKAALPEAREKFVKAVREKAAKETWPKSYREYLAYMARFVKECIVYIARHPTLTSEDVCWRILPPISCVFREADMIRTGHRPSRLSDPVDTKLWALIRHYNELVLDHSAAQSAGHGISPKETARQLKSLAEHLGELAGHEAD